MNSNQVQKKFTDQIVKYKNILVVSPHFDDAVLSAGDLIYFLVKKKITVTVVNIFTQGSIVKSGLTTKLLNQANFKNPTRYFAERQKEDQGALNFLGVNSIINLKFTDAAWRSHTGNHPIYQITTLGDISSMDSNTESEISLEIKKIISSINPELLICPLARGKHVDHQLARNISSNLFPNTIFYQDFPYSTKYPSEDEFILANKLQSTNWHSEYYPQKTKAVQNYTTQRSSILSNNFSVIPDEVYFFKP